MSDLTILYIEDERPLFTLVGSLMAKRHYPARLVWADSLAKGLEMLVDYHVGLVLLDLYLPDSQGLDTVKRIRAAAPQVPIVVLTGQGDDDLADMILESGAQEYLEKDELRPRVLFRAIRYAIERKKMEDSLLQAKTGLEEKVEERTRELYNAIRNLNEEVTERRLAEEALRESESHYRLLAENITDVIWTADLGLHFKYLSPSVTTLLGYRVSELMALGRKDVFTSASLELASRAIETALANERAGQSEATGTLELELELRRREGSTVWTDTRFSFLRDPKGAPLGLLAVTRDISESRSIRVAMQRNYDKQNAINSLLNLTLEDLTLEDMLSKALNILLGIPWLTSESQGAIFLVESDPDYLVMKVHNVSSGSKCRLCARIPVGKCVCGQAAGAAKTIFVDQIDHRHEFTHAGMEGHGHYCVPMLMGGQTMGIINLCLREGFVPQEGEEEFLTAYANALAMAVAHHRSEQALRESETRTRTILSLLPDPLVVYDMDGQVLFINEAFEKTFGWTLGELISRKLDFVPPEALPETMLNVNRMLRGELVTAFETKRTTKDGRKLDVLINTASFEEAGSQAGNIVVFRDITEIKTVEKALRDSETRYRNLVETISEGLLEVDQDNRITFCNQFFAQSLGYDKEALLGAKTLDMLDENNQAILRSQWNLRRQGKSSRYELGWTKADGGTLHCLVSATPLKDGQGNFRGALCLVTDITERKLLESQLLQAQKLESIGQLAAGIAHEINTPTQYVSDNTRFLRDAFYDLTRVLVSHLKLAKLAAGQETPPGPDLRQALEEAQAQYQEIDGDYLLEEVPKAIEQTLEGLGRISTIVRSMKEFAHPGPDTKTPTDINRAIENTVTVAKNEWKYVAEVTTDLAPDLPPVPCVPGELNQVFLNVIVNAAHAIGEVYKEGREEKGQIRISTRLLDQEVEVRISDSGPGIPEAIRNRVFDPFFTTKPPGKGTGQGLAIAYRVIEDKHGGKLSLESAPGQGATFVIRLPLQEASGKDRPQ